MTMATEGNEKILTIDEYYEVSQSLQSLQYSKYSKHIKHLKWFVVGYVGIITTGFFAMSLIHSQFNIVVDALVILFNTWTVVNTLKEIRDYKSRKLDLVIEAL